MPEPGLPLAEAMRSLPPEWPDDGLRAAIGRSLRESGTCVVVVDDDPTGTQTVHGVPILTTWGVPELAAELGRGESAFYVLTNSRALARGEARELALGLGRNLAEAARLAGRTVAAVSRSDSTLRGHYPVETDALAEGLGFSPDGVLIAPYFREGGRYTIADVHYVLEGERLVPAAETESARDLAFGYRHSDLRRWVEEKTEGRWPAANVVRLTLDLIRRGGPDAVAQALLMVRNGRPVIVNAASDRDLEVVVAGMMMAEDAGRRFLCRTAASFAKVRAGIADRGLLTAAELLAGEEAGSGGLVVVGSYVPRTTRQLQALLATVGWEAIELAVPDLLDPARAEAALAAAAGETNRHLAAGRSVVLYTSRELATGATAEESLGVGRTVSRALVSLVAALDQSPRFLIAKGGVTSSDVATAGLGVRRALVLGQIAPGVPVWRLGSESRFPGLAYVVFPGNVGTDTTLAEVAAALSGESGAPPEPRLGLPGGLAGPTDEWLTRVVVRSEGEPSEHDVRRIAEYVAGRGFAPADVERVRGRLIGLQWDGRALVEGDCVPTDVRHYLEHVLIQGAWPPDTTLEGYLESARRVVLGADTGIMATRIHGRWHVSFVAELPKPADYLGSDWVVVEYDAAGGHWWSVYRTWRGPAELVEDQRREKVRWLRPLPCGRA